MEANKLIKTITSILPIALSITSLIISIISLRISLAKEVIIFPFENIEINDGYLTVHASINKETEEHNDGGKYLQKERYSGECSRSFYIGENVKQEDVKASFKNGTLTLSFPKMKDKLPEEKKWIEIE